MRFNFPISKSTQLEDGRLLVEGIATSDMIDKQGERLLFKGSVDAFSQWFDTGPAVREQHDEKKAVGSGIEMFPIPDEGKIKVRVFVSKGSPDTQEKVRDGTLRAFSVGGEPKKWDMVKSGGKTVREISAWEMQELSLVDRPANTDCRIDLFKMDHTTDAVAKGEEMAKPKEKPPVEAEPEEGKKPPVPPAEEKPPEEEGEPTAEEVKPEGEGEETPAEEKVEGMELSEQQLGVIVTKVTDAVLAAMEKQKAAIAAAEPAPTIAKVDGMAAYDVRAALDCLACLESLRAVEAVEGEGEPPEQIKLLDAAIKSLKEFTVSEAGELLTPEPPAPVTAAAHDPEMKKMLWEILEKSVPPAPDERIATLIEQVGSLTKAIGDLKAVNGEVEAIRKGMDQILSMPVPGRAPLRFITPEALQKSLPSVDARVAALESMRAGADAVVRVNIDRELAFLRAEKGA